MEIQSKDTYINGLTMNRKVVYPFAVIQNHLALNKHAVGLCQLIVAFLTKSKGCPK